MVESPARKSQEQDPSALNAKQFEVLEKVARRAAIEESESNHRKRKAGDADVRNASLSNPLRWVVHGGPGTGKTHVIKSMSALFIEMFGWKQGVEFQHVALQAVMADQLDGDTIHHALGIQPFEKDGPGSSGANLTETARGLRHLRWLIIDEISMVSAAFLASIDMQLRSIMTNVHKTKKDGDNRSRPFGGLNVILVGDFCQLDPPSGVPLAGIPAEYVQSSRRFLPAATTAHGQSLLWGCGTYEEAVQGMTELTETSGAPTYG